MKSKLCPDILVLFPGNVENIIKKYDKFYIA